jgi:hypothetical protein
MSARTGGVAHALIASKNIRKMSAQLGDVMSNYNSMLAKKPRGSDWQVWFN